MSASKNSAHLRVLGVMTGTSCDSLDAACLAMFPDGWELLWKDSRPYPTALRDRVLAIQKPDENHTVRAWLEINRDLGDWYGKALASMIGRQPANRRPDLIANHGQTLGHFPAPKNQGTTVQAGDPTRIAFKTGITVVSHFRDGDMAAGGQGAPLAPLFHKILAHRLATEHDGIAIHNLGGISNLTYISPRGEVVAFDTGPANLWIDAATELVSRGKLHMDRGGALAQQGTADAKAMAKLLKHPFLKDTPPKSTGRDDFPFELLLSSTSKRDADLVATATAFTAETIAAAYRRWIIGRKRPLETVFVCGGGARNEALMRAIQERLPSIDFATLDEFGIDSKFIEAYAFAFFGFLTLFGEPIGGPWTGVKGFGPPGHITPGENWRELLKKVGLFVQG